MIRRTIQTNEVTPGASVTITLPGGVCYVNCTAILVDHLGNETELGKIVSCEPWRRIDLSPVDVFDVMTAAGFKLDLITGNYERNHAPKAYPS